MTGFALGNTDVGSGAGVTFGVAVGVGVTMGPGGGVAVATGGAAEFASASASSAAGGQWNDDGKASGKHERSN